MTSATPRYKASPNANAHLFAKLQSPGLAPAGATSSAPFSGICSVRVSKTSEFTNGTGFLIRGGWLLTAAHVVWDGSLPNSVTTRWATGSDIDADVSVHPSYKNQPSRDHDLALLQLRGDVPVGAHIFKLTAFDDDFFNAYIVAKYPVNIAGYPGDGDNGLFFASGPIRKPVQKDYLTYNIDTADGQSGSPIYYSSDADMSVMAVHAYHDEAAGIAPGGPRITTDVVTWIDNTIQGSNAALAYARRSHGPRDLTVVKEPAAARRAIPSVISFVRQSTPTVACIDQTNALSDFDFDRLISALQLYLNDCFAPVWGTPAKLVPAKQPKSGDWSLAILDDADSALQNGYHELTKDGMPLARVFVDSATSQNEPISVTASHELAEMLVDPATNLWCHERENVFHAYEACDAVEEEAFEVDGHAMSNFVFPSYFEAFRKANATQFDFLGKVSRPFQVLRGGYAITRVGKKIHLKFGSSAKERRFGNEDRRFHRSEHRAKRLRFPTRPKKAP